VLVPAGRLPGICLGLLSVVTRRTVAVRLVAAVVSVSLLSWYALRPAWPVLWSAVAVLVVMLVAGRVERDDERRVPVAR
jgi:hypothetical protein